MHMHTFVAYTYLFEKLQQDFPSQRNPTYLVVISYIDKKHCHLYFVTYC